MLSRVLWLGKNICDYWKLKSSKSRQRLAKCGEQIRNYRCCVCPTPSSCALAIVNLVVYSPLLTAHIAIIALAIMQLNVVGDVGEVETDDHRPPWQVLLRWNVLFAFAAAIMSFFVAYIVTWKILAHVTSDRSTSFCKVVNKWMEPSDDSEEAVFESECVIMFPAVGLCLACPLCYNLSNFDSCLEGAVKHSAVAMVRSCCESASINSTAMVNSCIGMTTAANITTQALSTTTSINSTAAAMICLCDTNVASEICFDYLQPLLHPYVLPLLLLSIAHILLLVPIPAKFFYLLFGLDATLANLYNRVFPPKPVNPNGEPATTC